MESKIGGTDRQLVKSGSMSEWFPFDGLNCGSCAFDCKQQDRKDFPLRRTEIGSRPTKITKGNGKSAPVGFPDIP